MSVTTSIPICLSCGGGTVARSDSAPLRLLVATADGLHEFGRASARAPWGPTGRIMLRGTHPSAVLFEPRSGLLFAGLHFQGGILASADGGHTWEKRNDGLRSEHIYTLTAQHVGDRTVLYAGTEPAMVYRSEDMGRTWTALPAVTAVPETYEWWFPFGTPHAKHIACDPKEPDTLYVCIEQGDLLKSVDGGKSWQPIFFHSPTDKLRRDMHRLVICPSNPRQLFLTGGTGTHYSEDAGATWTQLTDDRFMVGYPDPIFIHPQDESTLFLVGASAPPNPSWGQNGTANPAVARSRDRGRSWQRIMQGMPNPVRGNFEAAALHLSEAGLELFVGSACGELYSSLDEGDTWTRISAALPPISKGAHFRHFLQPAERQKYEESLIAIGGFKRALRVEDTSQPPPKHRAGLPR